MDAFTKFTKKTHFEDDLRSLEQDKFYSGKANNNLSIIVSVVIFSVSRYFQSVNANIDKNVDIILHMITAVMRGRIGSTG